MPDGTPLSSDNVSLVTTIPGTFAGMRIVGDKAFATGWDGVTELDISNPAQPVPAAFLPLPHFENEDVDSDGKIVLVSNDREKASDGGFLYVIDASTADVLKPLAVLSLNDLSSDLRGPGHIANCVGGTHGCKWAWLTGGRKIWVVDLRDPANPKLVRGFDTPVSTGARTSAAGARSSRVRHTTSSATPRVVSGSPVRVGWRCTTPVATPRTRDCSPTPARPASTRRTTTSSCTTRCTPMRRRTPRTAALGATATRC